MRPDDSDVGFVWDMLEASREAVSFVKGVTLDQYLENRLLTPRSGALGGNHRRSGEPRQYRFSG
jgi:hypothetical protein